MYLGDRSNIRKNELGSYTNGDQSAGKLPCTENNMLYLSDCGTFSKTSILEFA